MTPYDHAPSVPTDTAASGHSRSGSQKRQRTKSLQISLTPDEYAEVNATATASGWTPSSYGRAVVLGTPGPRARRRPSVDAQLLGHAIAALNRAGNVANQIAHRLNAAQSVGAGETRAALTEIREAARAIREAAGYKDHHDHQGEPPR
ncbi:MAG: hypothetical protein WA324_29080 [Bryobacteraceae bacterium]